MSEMTLAGPKALEAAARSGTDGWVAMEPFLQSEGAIRADKLRGVERRADSVLAKHGVSPGIDAERACDWRGLEAE
jgi:hypothetical protein